MYKLCVLAAGKGTRNKYALNSNKALLPLGKGTALSYIISRFPPEIEIVVAVGYNAIQVENYLLESDFSFRRAITCIEVSYEGEGKGPGYSLLKCAHLLQSPFIYTACDTIVIEDIPPPDWNWIGVSIVDERLPYLTVAQRHDIVTQVYDKGDKNATYLASIGLVGVRDYRAFWKGLANPTMVHGEHQDTSGINALIAHELHTEYFKWMDIGSTEGYEYANQRFNQEVS